jgi:hypothetical protein
MAGNWGIAGNTGCKIEGDFHFVVWIYCCPIAADDTFKISISSRVRGTLFHPR